MPLSWRRLAAISALWARAAFATDTSESWRKHGMPTSAIGWPPPVRVPRGPSALCAGRPGSPGHAHLTPIRSRTFYLDQHSARTENAGGTRSSPKLHTEEDIENRQGRAQRMRLSKPFGGASKYTSTLVRKPRMGRDIIVAHRWADPRTRKRCFFACRRSSSGWHGQAQCRLRTGGDPGLARARLARASCCLPMPPALSWIGSHPQFLTSPGPAGQLTSCRGGIKRTTSANDLRVALRSAPSSLLSYSHAEVQSWINQPSGGQEAKWAHFALWSKFQAHMGP